MREVKQADGGGARLDHRNSVVLVPGEEGAPPHQTARDGRVRTQQSKATDRPEALRTASRTMGSSRA